MKTVLTMIALLITTTAIGTTTELTILTPPEHSTIHSKDVYVVGTSTSAQVAIFVNGSKTAVVPVKDSVFHASVSFGFGISEVTAVALEPSDSISVASTETVEILYGPRMNTRYQRIYADYQFHGSELEFTCVGCHALDESNSTGDGNLISCLGCHTVLRDSFRRHTKSDSRACVICHDPENPISGVTGASDNLCFKCHEDRRGMFSQDFIHGPVAGGSCAICHNPHGSPYERSLKQPVQILCYSCHTQVEEQLKRHTLHPPFKEGKCTECHNPHSTNNRWVLVKNSQELCLKCHSPDGNLNFHNHPYNVKPTQELRTPLKLTSRGQLECLSCHNPHAGEAEHLLRISQKFTCAGCHEEKL